MRKGFSLIEILIVMMIASVVFTGFYTTSMVGSRYIIDSKNRLAATALVNEKMEIVRNLAYDDIGTQGSVSPVGNILKDEDVTANGRSYHVRTAVSFVDDPLDGNYPSDTIQDDYKVVKVEVSWNSSDGQTQKVSAVSRFVPPGLETSVGGAPLAINVGGDDGSAVSQASVHIVNNDVSPTINDNINTDVDGHIMIPAAPISAGNYHLTISKNGHETVATMDTTASFIPIYGHVSVISGSLNTYNFIQNRLATLTVRSADYQNNPIGDIGFSIGGGKIMGHDDLGNNVFSMSDTTGTTGASSGEKEYADISPGNYAIAMSTNSQYEFIDFDPAVSPAVIVPGDDATYTIRVADKNIASLFLKIIDNDDNHPIANAEVTLTDNGGNDIFAGKISSLRGVVFYPDGSNPLTPETYTLKIEAGGYETKTESITINNELTSLEIKLVKS